SIGANVSHVCIATHACILTREPSTTRFRGCFTRHTTLPYPSQPALAVLLQ
ncbi:LOW QUALITY PROTEIN: leucine rich protein, partial [Streptomyces lividans TK24]